MSQQNACNAAAALSARCEESKLRALRVVASLRGETPAAQADLRALPLRGPPQGRNPPAIDLGELFELGVRELFLGIEKAPVDRLGVKFPERFEDGRAVLRTNGANRDLRAVFQPIMNVIVGEIAHGRS